MEFMGKDTITHKYEVYTEVQSQDRPWGIKDPSIVQNALCPGVRAGRWKNK